MKEFRQFSTYPPLHPGYINILPVKSLEVSGGLRGEHQDLGPILESHVSVHTAVMNEGILEYIPQ